MIEELHSLAGIEEYVEEVNSDPIFHHPLLAREDEKKVVWDAGRCVQCDTCIRVCPHDSSPKIRWMTVADVLAELQRSLPYIDGITTSGGDCTLYNEFLIELFTEVKKLNKTCLIDSNGSFDFEKDPRVLDVCDGVMLNVKAYDSAWHDFLINHDRRTVIKDLEYLLHVNKLYEVRTLIFPDRDEENEATVSYVSGIIGDRCRYKIIRYRPYGVRDKYAAILGESETEKEYAEKYAELAKSLGAANAVIV